jgi:hypothetical protein
MDDVPTNPSPKRQLFDEAVIVHDEFDRYISLHNEIFKTQASVVSLVKRLFGFRVPFAKHYAHPAAAKQRWTELNSRVHSLVAETWPKLSHEEQMFAVALREYVKVLEATLYTLEVRQKALYLKAESGTPLPWNVFRTLEREYRKAIAECRRIGNEVNRLLTLCSNTYSRRASAARNLFHGT